MLERLNARLSAPWQARAQLHVGADRLRLQVTRPGLRALRSNDASCRELMLSADEPLADAMASWLQEVAPKLGRTRVDVTVEDDAVRLFSVVPPAGARGWADLHAAAALRFERLYGESLNSAWILDAAWHARRSFVAVAMPRPLQDALLEPLAKVRWPIASLAPNFGRRWHEHRGRLHRVGTWLMVWGATERVTVWARADDGDRIRQTSAPLMTWGEPGTLRRWVEAEALQLDVEVPHTLVLGGLDSEDAALEQRIDVFTVIGRIASLPVGANRSASA